MILLALSQPIHTCKVILSGFYLLGDFTLIIFVGEERTGVINQWCAWLNSNSCFASFLK